MTAAKTYWMVHIGYGQTDNKIVLVDAPTAEQAENLIRARGCNARYIRAQGRASVMN